MRAKKARQRPERSASSPAEQVIAGSGSRSAPTVPAWTPSPDATENGSPQHPTVELADGRVVEGMVAVWLDPETVEPHPDNPRVDYGDEELEELEEEMRAHGGNHTPALFWVAEDGKRYLLAGHRRRLAALRAGTRLLCMEFVGDEVEAMTVMASENLHRKGFSEWEKCRSALNLFRALERQKQRDPSKEVNLTYRGLARRLNVKSWNTVANWLCVARGISRDHLEGAGYFFGSQEEAELEGKTSVSHLKQKWLRDAAEGLTDQDKIEALRRYLPKRRGEGAVAAAAKEERPAYELTMGKDGGITGIRLKKTCHEWDSEEATAFVRDTSDLFLGAIRRSRPQDGQSVVLDDGGQMRRLYVLPIDRRLIMDMSREEIEEVNALIRKHLQVLDAAKRNPIRQRAEELRDATLSAEPRPTILLVENDSP